MKRPVQPVDEYREHHGYPPVEREDVSRREFLGKAAATAVIAGAATAGVTILPSEARAARKDKDTREKISLSLGRFRLGKSSMSVRRIIVWTGDKKMARWLRKYSNRRGVTTALSPILRKAKADVLVDGKQLYRLERKLGAALNRYYRKKSGKSSTQPDLMLVVGRYWRPRLRGIIRPPILRPRRKP